MFSPWSTRLALSRALILASAKVTTGDAIVHYAPGEHPLCGTESMTAVYTDNPAISGPPQPGCLELG